MSQLVMPFPWFGGKSRAATQIWSALGPVKNYIEPFCGSAAALLGRPGGAGPIETINDSDGLLVNAIRSIAHSPEETAQWCDWPVSEADLTARHLWLVERRAALTNALLVDPDAHDPRAAGYWIWGSCCWIGNGFASGLGPWVVDGGQLVKRRNAGRGINRKLPHLGDAGRGINRKLPHLGDAGRGINRQLPHLGDAGRGINRQLPHLGDAGQGINRQLPHLGDAPPAAEWLRALAGRLRRVRIACGDWRRVLTPVCAERHRLTGVLLDPPYPAGCDQDGFYAGQDDHAGSIFAEVVDAAIDLDRRGCRVVVCGYDGTWSPPPGWATRRWVARAGYVKDKSQPKREVLWCSPNCLSEIS